MPVDKWAWINYQTEVSLDAPQYACKVLSAGAILIALDIIKHKLNGPLSSEEGLKEYMRGSANYLVPLKKNSGRRLANPFWVLTR